MAYDVSGTRLDRNKSYGAAPPSTPSVRSGACACIWRCEARRVSSTSNRLHVPFGPVRRRFPEGTGVRMDWPGHAGRKTLFSSVSHLNEKENASAKQAFAEVISNLSSFEMREGIQALSLKNRVQQPAIKPRFPSPYSSPLPPASRWAICLCTSSPLPPSA